MLKAIYAGIGAAGMASMSIASPTASANRASLTLAGNGFSVGGQVARFKATSRASAIALASQVLGKPIKFGSHGDCGQGDIIVYAKFRDDFELSFVNGKLSGWTEDSSKLATGKNLRVGMTVAALRKAYPDVMTDRGDEENGGLGPSFQREGGPNGWINGVKPLSKITGLFAGATCLAGV